jgi:hypothetical protein
MKQELDEEGIRRLFRDQRQADERLAPHFSATLEAALSRRRVAHSGRLVLRSAVALGALVAIIFSVFFFLPRSVDEQPAIVAYEPDQPDNAASSTPVVLPPRPKRPAIRPPRSTRKHRESPQRAETLISQWRSPTDFLLRTPGDELLKTVPRVGTSAIEIKMNFPDGKN